MLVERVGVEPVERVRLKRRKQGTVMEKGLQEMGRSKLGRGICVQLEGGPCFSWVEVRCPTAHALTPFPLKRVPHLASAGRGTAVTSCTDVNLSTPVFNYMYTFWCLLGCLSV